VEHRQVVEDVVQEVDDPAEFFSARY